MRGCAELAPSAHCAFNHPRWWIIPQPEATLHGDTARFCEGIVRSGQEIARRIGYHQVTEFDASAPSRWRSRACLALACRRRTGIRAGRPHPSKGRPDFFPLHEQAPQAGRIPHRGPRTVSARAQERSAAKSALSAGQRNAAISMAFATRHEGRGSDAEDRARHWLSSTRRWARALLSVGCRFYNRGCAKEIRQPKIRQPKFWTAPFPRPERS